MFTEEQVELYLRKQGKSEHQIDEILQRKEYRRVHPLLEIREDLLKPKKKIDKKNKVDKNERKNEDKEEKKKNKYKNKKIIIDDICFDSMFEAEHYLVLKDKKLQREIIDFELQPVFILQEGFYTNAAEWNEPIKYIGDFKVIHNDETIEIIDTKGFKTKDFIIKKKLFEKKFPNYKLTLPKKLKKTTKITRLQIILYTMAIQKKNKISIKDEELLFECAKNEGLITDLKELNSDIKNRIIAVIRYNSLFTKTEEKGYYSYIIDEIFFKKSIFSNETYLRNFL